MPPHMRTDSPHADAAVTGTAGDARCQREIMRAITDYIVVIDRGGRIAYINHPAPGLTMDEVLGSNWLDWLDPADRPSASEAITATLATGKEKTIEFRAIGPGRQLTWFQVKFSPALAGVDEVVLIARDITKRRVIEGERDANHRLLNALINSPRNVYIFSLDRNYCYTTFNERHRQGMREVWNATIDVGVNLLDCMTDTHLRELAKRSIDRALAGESFSEVQFQPSLGIYYEFLWNPITSNEGSIDGVTVFVRDITLKHQAQAALVESEARYRAILDASPDNITITDLAGKVLMVSKAGVKLMRCKNEAELRGQSITSFVAPADRDRALANIAFMFEGVMTGPGEYRAMRSDGSEFDMEANGDFILDAGGKPLGMVFVIRDIGERKRAEAALRESEERYRTLVEASPESITVHRDGSVIYVNPAAVEMFGATSPQQLVGLPTEKLLHPDFHEVARARAQDIMERGISAPLVRMKFVKLDGADFEVEVRGTPVIFDGRPAIQGNATDITARRAAERKLERINRLYVALLECSQAIMRCGSASELFLQVCRDAVTYGGAGMAWIGLVDECDCVRPAASFGDDAGYLDDIHITMDPGEASGNGPTGTAIRENSAYWCQDFLNDPCTVPWRARAENAGWRASAALPLRCDGKTVGALTLYLAEANAFDPDIRALLTGLAIDISFALERFQSEAARANAESALRTSESRYRQLFESNPQPMWVFDEASLAFTAVNAAAIEHYGYTREEFLGMSIKDIRPPEDVEQLCDHLAKPHDSLHKAGIWRHRRQDGSIILVDVTTHVLNFEDRPARLVLAHDVTEQVRLESALIESEAFNLSILDSVSTEIAVLDHDGIITAVNQPWRRFAAANSKAIGEVPRGTEIGANYFAACRDVGGSASESASAACAGIRAVLEGRIPAFQMEYDCHGPDVQRWFSMSVTPLGADRQGVVVAHTDITNRKQAEMETRALTRVIEQNPSSIVITDRAGNIEYVNPRFEQVTGYSPHEVVGKNPRLLKSGNTAPEVYVNLWSAISQGGDWRGEICNRRKNGELFWERATISGVKNEDGEIEHYVAVKEDITEHKRRAVEREALEAQLWQSQKMEAVGKLAGGIAHDFNNIIATILGNAELAREDVPSTNPLALESLREISIAGKRARSLVQQLLAFSRRSPIERKSTDMAGIVDESTRLLRSILPARIDLNVHCGSDLPRVFADATQLQQVLINLVTNAMQAIDGRPGCIEVSLQAVMVDAAIVALRPELHALHAAHPGRAACLTVKDNGPGIEPAMLEQIFEPFFTTKLATKGTGLGLSVVHGIVRTHEGAIVVDSAPGKGATFSIYLPAAPGATGAIESEPLPQQSVATSPATLGPRIIYVDDDEALVFLMQRLLERRGFRVRTFIDQKKALAVLRDEPNGCDLLVTDYNMPGMSGLDVAREARAIRADLPVAVISGYIDATLQAQASAIGARELIFKANDVEELCSSFVRLAKSIDSGSM